MRQIIDNDVKNGIKIIPKEGNIIQIEGGCFPVRQYTYDKYGYSNQYLSWENASYMYAESGEEEANDYLLYHALQEEKKLCVSFYTKKESQIRMIFGNNKKYDIISRPAESSEHQGFSYVFVIRKGCLADYFDMDKIEDIYQSEGFRTGCLISLENIPLIDFFNGNCSIDGVAFDTYVDTENPKEDDVLRTFGPLTLMIIGLLYGYPIEITMAALRIIFPNG